ncbi:MAG: ASKHA domain-containing protein [Candidatus Promineifilaceae bacterium]|nr:ASKHA domain-containing protein [Candidatus Promineifilaceae bacterium]
MAEHRVEFDGIEQAVQIQTGTLLTEAAKTAGIDLSQPCGGQGRCGRCAVKVIEGRVRQRSTLRLSAKDIAQGYALACQAVIESDATIYVPPQDTLERYLTTDRTVATVAVPAQYDPVNDQPLRRITLQLPSPSLDDQRDDWSRLHTAIRQETGINELLVSLPLLTKIGSILRAGEWRVTAVIDTMDNCPSSPARMVDLHPDHVPLDTPLWGAAIDIGTTTVTIWLVDLVTGQVKQQVAEYNRQIRRGEDVISRIIYAGKNNGNIEMRELVLNTINDLLHRACQRAKADRHDILRTTVAGNSIMMHLFLGIPAGSIRASPFVTAVNHAPTLTAREVGLEIHPEATVDCLPGIASYVGADISAGVLSSGMDDTEQISLFMDIGTNGETVLGSKDWLVTCACSAGPAFEGAGVQHGMRATRGAIEEVWINGESYEPTCRIIGDGPPKGFCGSGLISLLAEMFLTGIVDKSGNFNTTLPTKRIRQGTHGWEYVVAWAGGNPTPPPIPEPVEGQQQPDPYSNGRSAKEDITITHVDIDNLIRAKAAIYAGFTVLAESVGLPLDAVEQVLIGGAFGKYINVEKAVEIGLLPDMPWENFHFLGNTSVLGAYYALLDQRRRERIKDIASRMTYIELSADNSFYEAFTSALFLPHTDLERFPSVSKMLTIS